MSEEIKHNCELKTIAYPGKGKDVPLDVMVDWGKEDGERVLGINRQYVRVFNRVWDPICGMWILSVGEIKSLGRRVGRPTKFHDKIHRQWREASRRYRKKKKKKQGGLGKQRRERRNCPYRFRDEPSKYNAWYYKHITKPQQQKQKKKRERKK